MENSSYKRLTPYELAQTFPEAETVLKQLIKTDRQILLQHKVKMRKVSNYLALSPTYSLFGLRDETLIAILVGREKNHIMQRNINFNKVWPAEERLVSNEKLLRLIEWKPAPNDGWIKRVEIAKQFLITDLLKFNRAGFTVCPFHTERTASLKYYPKNNSWYCFGCNDGGDVIDLFKKLHNVSFKDAVNKLSS